MPAKSVSKSKLSALPKGIFAPLHKEQEITFRNLDRFEVALKNLRYEGKQKIGRNINELEKWILSFNDELEMHMRREERVLFPFLQMYIPRLEPIIRFWLAEHADIRNCYKNVRQLLVRFKKSGADRTALLSSIGDQGSYLVCLVRSHVGLGIQSLYRVAENELRPHEKKRLVERMHALSKAIRY